jgi:ribosomal protein S27AE
MAQPIPPPARVVLACTSCEHVYEPDLDTFDGGDHTGCPRCGDWTFIAELAEPGDHHS